MYFNLIKPKEGRERDAAHEWARGPYAEHQWLWQFFPAPEGTRRDFLFRRWDIEGMPRFYVVSKRPPKLLSNAWNVQTRDYAPKLEVGAHLRFDLRANPVVTHSAEGKHARHDVVMQEKKRLLQERGLSRWTEWEDNDRPALYTLVHTTCGAWLRERASRLGFQLDEANLAVDSYQQHKERNSSLRFSSVDLSGKLTVVDPTAFDVALRDGIGPAKAFGCGLMLVRRI